MPEMQITSTVSANHHDDAEYAAYMARIQARFDDSTGGSAHVFTTDVSDLFSTFLDNLPSHDRQYHTCSCCRRFVETFGGLVTISEGGVTASPIWDEDDAPHLYKAAVAAMAARVRRGKVTGVFKSKDEMWGQPVTGPWRHFAVRPSSHLVHHHPVLTAGQSMAEKREEYAIVNRALVEWDATVIDAALGLLETESLYRSEKVKGPVKWLSDLRTAKSAAKGDRARNIVWHAIAAAPAGFCHPRSSMAGTLLDDIASGVSFDDASRRFAAKMHPLQYQRPQAPPSAGNIAQGEKVIAALGAERSLHRRFARLDEVEAVWAPSPAKEDATPSGGVFAHLKTKGAAPSLIAIDAPPVTITWEKFARTVLPAADAIDLYMKPRDNYTALVTAVHADAPPILQWDREARRNPVSWYVWNGGSTPEQFSVSSMSWQPVSAICLRPSMWGGGNEHQGKGVMILLRDARETRMSGNALFPEILREELRGIRATIEAYSKSATIEGMESGNACGLALQNGAPGSWEAVVRVTSGARVAKYRLDRWD